MDIKVGDIIDGRRVTKVFELCGSLAYQSEPAGKIKDKIDLNPPEEPKVKEPELVKEEEPEKPKRGRRKKEA